MEDKGAGEYEKAITVELTHEQQELIRRQSGGRLEITQFKLRPDLDMGKAIDRNRGGAEAADVATRLAPPPKGTYWV